MSKKNNCLQQEIDNLKVQIACQSETIKDNEDKSDDSEATDMSDKVESKEVSPEIFVESKEVSPEVFLKGEIEGTETVENPASIQDNVEGISEVAEPEIAEVDPLSTEEKSSENEDLQESIMQKRVSFYS